MNKFEKGVPFDPGYSQHAFSFMENIAYLTTEYVQLKSPHQKKFKLSLIEAEALILINKCSAFYLGCILWGSFIHYRFKDNPKEILGNAVNDLSEEELKNLDFSTETKFMLEYIEQFDKDCKYFLKKPAKVDDFIIKVLKSYNEFVELNNNFLNVNYTNDIKLPEAVEHFRNMTNEQLDNLYAEILKVLESGKIENLLELGFYEI